MKSPMAILKIYPIRNEPGKGSYLFYFVLDEIAVGMSEN